MRSLLLFLLFLLSLSGFSQISVSPGQVNFTSVLSGTPQTRTLTVQNNSGSDLEVQDLQLFHGDVFTVSPSSFSLANGASQNLTVTCEALHNLDYTDYLLFKSKDLSFSVKVFAHVEYADSYYVQTQNKSHEDLKAALKNTVTSGSAALSYSYARDLLFMNIDNEAVNGQGASQNTLTCVYTGNQAVGYINRSDCQNTYGFNTEHTIPQSFFNELLPMRSDLHHLFPVTATSNGQRSSNPYGVITTTPIWQEGGSKSDGFTFEPRDQHKGTAARACLYFVIRYQDYQGFVAPQENLLRQWAASFAPTAWDSVRNDLVQSYQHNRNPFVDHPEFLDRIASVCTEDFGPSEPILHQATDTLDLGLVPAGMTHRRSLFLSNQGYSDLMLSNISFSDPAFQVAGNPLGTIAPDSLLNLKIEFRPMQPFAQYTATLTFLTNDPNQDSVKVFLTAETGAVSIEDPLARVVRVAPNPCNGLLSLQKDNDQALQGAIYDLQGRQLRSIQMPPRERHKALDLLDLPNGIYLLRLQQGEHSSTQRISLQK